MTKKKKSSDVIISFENSESVNGVTGSSVKVNDNILIECGMMQGKGIVNGYSINNANFKFKVRELEYVFLLHSHL